MSPSWFRESQSWASYVSANLWDECPSKSSLRSSKFSSTSILQRPPRVETELTHCTRHMTRKVTKLERPRATDRAVENCPLSKWTKVQSCRIRWWESPTATIGNRIRLPLRTTYSVLYIKAVNSSWAKRGRLGATRFKQLFLQMRVVIKSRTR